MKRAPKGLKDFRSTNSLAKGLEGRLCKYCPPIVSVVWIDACVSIADALSVEPGWENHRSCGTVMNTVGFLLRQNRDWLTISMERDGETNNGFRRVQDIPACSVVRMEILRQQT